jgi:isoleucyl-tRNA synthetase
VNVDEVDLLPGEVTVSARGLTGFEVSEDAGLLVALDIRVTDELRREGQAREIVRYVNEARKDAGLQIADRIVLGYEVGAGDGAVSAAFNAYRDYICRETLAVELLPRVDVNMHRWSGEVDGAPLTLGVRKVSG